MKTKEIEEKFKKLGINSFLELSLIIPSAYEDLRVNKKLIPHTKQVIDATVESIYKSPNSIQITFLAIISDILYKVYSFTQNHICFTSLRLEREIIIMVI